jgi:hypothetical protein
MVDNIGVVIYRITGRIRSPYTRTGATAMSRKKISTTVYITPEQLDKLKSLNDKTKVPVAEYIRQGIDLILEKYKDKMPGQLDLTHAQPHA